VGAPAVTLRCYLSVLARSPIDMKVHRLTCWCTRWAHEDIEDRRSSRPRRATCCILRLNVSVLARLPRACVPSAL